MVNTLDRRTASPRGRYWRWLFGTVFLVILGSASFAVTASLIKADRPPGGLVISPSVDDRGDEHIPEATRIRAVYRLSNPSNHPIRVTSIRTSCDFLATLEGAEAPPRLPLILEPGDATEIVLETVTNARKGEQQTYTLVVESDIEGRSLPDVFARLSFRVREVLKASPESLVMTAVPIDEPLERSIILYTWGDNSSEMPEVTSSNPERILASLVPVEGEPEARPGASARHAIEVTIPPPVDDSDVEGSILVRLGDRIVETIPVQCVYRRPFRLSPPRLIVDLSGGGAVTRDVFLESDLPECLDWEPSEASPGVSAEILPFDSATRIVRVTVDDQAPEDGVDEGPRLVLRTPGGEESATIPIEITGRP